MTTERVIALALLMGSKRKLTKPEMSSYAKALGVTTRSIYRYLDKIEKARFLIADFIKPVKFDYSDIQIDGTKVIAKFVDID